MGKRRVPGRPWPALAFFAGFGLLAVFQLAREAWPSLDPPPAPGYRPVTLAELGHFQVKEPEMPSGFLQTGHFPAPKAVPTATVYPESIRALDQAEAVVPGFMLPFELDGRGKVVGFYLIRTTLVCCFGRPPRLNEMVRCETSPKYPEEFLDNVPIRVYGRLLVGELRQFGQVQALYRMKVERVERLRNPDRSTQYVAKSAGGVEWAP